MSQADDFGFNFYGSEPGAGTPDPPQKKPVTYTVSPTELVGGSVNTCPLAQKKSEPEVKPVTIRASIFFDGTGNNRTNTANRKNPLRPYFWSDSYDNDNSNVEIMERLLDSVSSVDYSFSVYVAGIGTTNLGADTFFGNAFGTWSTGVKDRVNDCFTAVFNTIKGLGFNQYSPLTIYIDSFGFSRGAAAARYFVYQIMTHENSKAKVDGRTLEVELTNIGYNVSLVKIKFLGLFDCVASYGWNIENDTTDLRLEATTSPEKVVHLASADEHRKNFPLTNIDSWGGIEIFLPGVHSDIGGGYQQIVDEKVMLLFDPNNAMITGSLEAEKNRLVNSGWYRKDELIIEGAFLTGKRTVYNHYSRIPLLLMKNYASKCGLTFSTLEDKYPIPSTTLQSAKNKIMAYIDAKGANKKSSINDWSFNDPIMLKLRHEFFHFSADYNTIGMEPQLWSSGLEWKTTAANSSKWERKRREYPG